MGKRGRGFGGRRDEEEGAKGGGNKELLSARDKCALREGDANAILFDRNGEPLRFRKVWASEAVEEREGGRESHV